MIILHFHLQPRFKYELLHIVYLFQWLKLNYLEVTRTIHVTSNFLQDLSKPLQYCELENNPRKTHTLIGLKLRFY